MAQIIETWELSEDGRLGLLKEITRLEEQLYQEREKTLAIKERIARLTSLLDELEALL